MDNKKYFSLDGNNAAAYIGYALSDVACIFPITPSTPMAELCDEWAAKDTKNIFGNTVKVVEMQSEGGAAGAVHGAACTGALTTTYTASQGLLLMIPNMYKIAGECLPIVFHVSARSLAAQSLCIFGDHQDVMACRQTGFCMLASNNVQEAMDMALVAHVSALKASLPFLHFFDGFRTSHEINKIEEISYDVIKKMVPMDKVIAFKKKAHNPEHPKLTGSTQNDDTYFQSREANNALYDKVYGYVKETMDELANHTGRKYAPYEYFGANDATHVVVLMGSGADAVCETLETLLKSGKKYGVLKVHLYRPFFSKPFVEALPKTVKKICVLDRTKESGSVGEPLYEDVVTALNIEGKTKIKVISGRYGLGSKDFDPTDVVSIFDNMKLRDGKKRFTIGIVDDVTHTSLKRPKRNFDLHHNYVECKFWGLGSDGTISANKSSIKIIGSLTKKYVQGYFEYDSKKSGGLTISHLRMSDSQIRSPYYLKHPNFIGIHNFTYVNKYDTLEGLCDHGTVLLNSIYDKDEVAKYLPTEFKRKLIQTKSKLYVIDAYKVAANAGLGNRINVIMQSCFFKIANIIDYKVVEKAMKDSAIKLYSRKGDAVVAANMAAIDAATKYLQEVDMNVLAKTKTITHKSLKKTSQFYSDFCDYIDHHNGRKLPVSRFSPDGSFPTGTTQYEKRAIGNTVPEWNPEKCIQCGQCSFVCPHAAIRAKVVSADELKNAPKGFKSKDSIGVAGAKYTIQVSAKDCTGCASCANVCPLKDSENKPLTMTPIAKVVEQQDNNWQYFQTLKNIPTNFKKETVKGLQFYQPYLEFSGACAGCGETPYIKVITQLFGDKMVVANATGCSSIWGGSSPTVPYCMDENGHGPSWANSLFEDNAEFGFGMALGLKQRRLNVINLMKKVVADPKAKEQTKQAINNVLNNLDNEKELKKYLPALKEACHHQPALCEHNCTCMQQILTNIDTLAKKSVWIFGGDGWAYDIGFGGLDHVLASGENVNIFVLDTEVYSNTGGQASKSSPIGAVAKFAASGKPTRKKNLAEIAMSYKDVYVAQVSMGANQQQCINALTEAEAYNGVSIVIAYAPCINHGINMSKSQNEMKKAVECGYWQLFRYNPLTKKVTVDSADPTANYQDFLKGEARYAQLLKKAPERAKQLFALSEQQAKEKLSDLKKRI